MGAVSLNINRQPVDQTSVINQYLCTHIFLLQSSQYWHGAVGDGSITVPHPIDKTPQYELRIQKVGVITTFCFKQFVTIVFKTSK